MGKRKKYTFIKKQYFVTLYKKIKHFFILLRIFFIIFLYYFLYYYFILLWILLRNIKEKELTIE